MRACYFLLWLVVWLPRPLLAQPLSSTVPVGPAAHHQIYSATTAINTLAGIVADVGQAIMTAAIYGTISYGAVTTVPATLTLDLTHGMIDCASTDNAVTISGPILAPPTQQIFTNCGLSDLKVTTAQVFYPEWLGAQGDWRFFTGCSIASASTTLTCPAGSFTPAMVGRRASVQGAGAAGAYLNTTVAAMAGDATLILALAAATTVTATAEVDIGTDDVLAIQYAIDAVGWGGGGVVEFNRRYFLHTIGSTGGPGRMIFCGWDNMTMRGSGTIRVENGRVPGGNAIFIGGVVKAPTPALRNTAFTTQSWYEQSNPPTYYPLSGATQIGSLTVTLATPADAGNFVPGDWVFLRTGQMIAANTSQPDAEINQVAAVDAGTGLITLSGPLRRPLQQEYFVTGTTGYTARAVTANLAVYGIAKVTAITSFNFTLAGLTFWGAEDNTLWHAESLVGFVINQVRFERGQGLWTGNNYRDGRCLDSYENITTAASWMCDGATGITDMLVQGNRFYGKGVVHIHEGTSIYHFLNNEVYATGTTPDVVTVISRPRDVQIIGNTIYHIRTGNIIRFDSTSYEDTLVGTSGIISDNHLYCTAPTYGIRVLSQGVLLGQNNTTTCNIQYGIDVLTPTKTLSLQQPIAKEMLAAFVTVGTPNPALGLLPAYAYVTNVFIHVVNAFNSDGTDQLTVGYDGTPAAYATAVDVSTGGLKAVTLGSSVGLNTAETGRAVEVYYTAGGSAPTLGKALVMIEYYRAPRIPTT
jgi:hypothetical protein